MRAVIIATGQSATGGAVTGERAPGFLLPLIDRPFLQHVVEFLVDGGIVSSIDVVLSHLPERVESLLKDGTRWGIEIRHHLTRDASKPYGVLARLNPAGRVLLVHGDRLPQAPLQQEHATSGPIAYCSDGAWGGWALLDSETLAGINADWDEQQVSEFIMQQAHRRGVICDCPIVLGARSENEFIASQRAALEKRFTGLNFYGREVQEGIWLARNVAIHPTATLTAPVYIGENSRIGEGIRFGPNVVVVRDCVLDSGTRVTESAILPGSYVGQALELDHVIVDRNRLINVREGGEAIVRDDFILSGITRTSFRDTVAGLASRAIALVLLVMAWPILLLTALALRLFRRGPVVHSMPVLRLPAAENPWEWEEFQLVRFAAPGGSPSAFGHLVQYFLPGLINVLLGQIRLIGVAPRTKEEVLALPIDWRILYLRAHAGLVTEAFALHGAAATTDEIYSCEVYYSVAAGPRHDANVLLRYLVRLFQPQRRERGPIVTDERGEA